MSLEAECEALVADVIGTKSPGVDECLDVCGELATAFAELPELAAVLALGCVAPCVAAATEAEQGVGDFSALFCDQILHLTPRPPPPPPPPAPSACGAEGQACCARPAALCQEIDVVCSAGEARCRRLQPFFQEGDNALVSGDVSVCKPALEGFSFVGASYNSYAPNVVMCSYHSESKNEDFLVVSAASYEPGVRPCGFGVTSIPGKSPEAVGKWQNRSCRDPSPSQCPWTYMPEALTCPSDARAEGASSFAAPNASEARRCGSGEYSCYDGAAPALGQYSRDAGYFVPHRASRAPLGADGDPRR